MADYFNIGQVINTHGVHGELKILPLTDDITRFKTLKYVLIDDMEKNILGVKFQKDKVILKVEGINSMDEAMKYRGKYIKINRKDAVPLEENTYFIADLVKCEVFDTNGEKIGKVYEVVKTGSNDVYWIKGEKEVLVPALKDIVKEVDIDNFKITIRPVEEWQA
ncbi:ribosome maturation factor RimM [Haloimpatiens lingqiaonensis]|uniref:ribosome maturation factor RimM n=1 Tax=Haloimpatiens lingqiaonensis TaxID=1380675 RepID=UPI0010FDD959|nr:ribosome maturation factor RimM [Haloimpatiens lingqiaonensis]